MSAQVSFNSPNITAAIDATLTDGTDPHAPEDIVHHQDGGTFHHPVVDLDFSLTSVPGNIASAFPGPYDLTVYWEGMGKAPEDSTSVSAAGSWDGSKMQVNENIPLGIHQEGVYKVTVVAKINQGPISEIAGFKDLGMIQVVN